MAFGNPFARSSIGPSNVGSKERYDAPFELIGEQRLVHRAPSWRFLVEMGMNKRAAPGGKRGELATLQKD